LILNLILKQLKQGKDAVSEAAETILDLGLTNEILKEHLLSLSMNGDLVREFESVDSQVKAALTREFNKRHASNTTGKVKKGGKKAPK
jgi:hypothetical protein